MRFVQSHQKCQNCVQADLILLHLTLSHFADSVFSQIEGLW